MKLLTKLYKLNWRGRKHEMQIIPALFSAKTPNERRLKNDLQEFLVEKNKWISDQMKQRDDRPNQRYLEGMKTVCCQVLNFLGKDK